VSRIAAVKPVFPQPRYSQETLTAAFTKMCNIGEQDVALLDRVHRNARVETRHLALPLEEYLRLDGFGAANDAFVRVGVDLGERAIKGAVAQCGLALHEVDVLMTVSVTGIAAPSLDARLANRLPLRADVKRIPVFGLGCVAGAAGVARLHDYLAGHPDDVAVLLSVELCSLTVQRDDRSASNLVASGLFGDGAAAVVMVGEGRAQAMDGPTVLATRSRLYPGTEGVMGWDIVDSGFQIVLTTEVAELVHEYLGDDVRTFLDDHDLTCSDIGCWVAHPGGPKVLEAMQDALDLPDGALDAAWRSLRGVGNLSSASVLHVFADTLAQRPPAGTPSLLLAMGPGFCAELVLLRW
jgi:alkylresorcinol/alkylpyrone synthase